MTPSTEDLPALAPAPEPTSGPGLALAPGEDLEPAYALPEDDEPAAWAEVLAGWDDEARHRAYVSRFADLEGLATAGGRYRAVLAERPGDAVARRFRDEVLRRALAQGLASLPREPDRTQARRLVRIAATVLLGTLLAVVGYMAVRLLVGYGAHA